MDYHKFLKQPAAHWDGLDAAIREFFPLTPDKCPKCGSAEIHWSRHKGDYESFILPLLFRRPFRCDACALRFFGFTLGWPTVKRMMLVILILVVVVALTLLFSRMTQSPPHDGIEETGCVLFFSGGGDSKEVYAKKPCRHLDRPGILLGCCGSRGG